MGREIVKQLIDQPLHILMGIVSVCVLSSLMGVWFGVGFTVAWIAAREYNQWPSSRWWDPPLDWFFEAVGIGAGYYLYVEYVSKWALIAP